MITEAKAIKLVEKERIQYNKHQQKLKEKDFRLFKKALFKEIKTAAKKGNSSTMFTDVGYAVVSKQTSYKYWEARDLLEKLKNILEQKGYRNIKIETKSTDRSGFIEVLEVNFEDKVKNKY